MNQPPSFLHDIPSIHQKNPAIPVVFANLDLNRGVQAGDELNYDEVIHANAVAMALKGYGDIGDPLATPEMIKTSSSRAIAVETAYAAVEYCPQNIFHELQQINHRLGNLDDNVQNIDNNVKIGLAQTENLRIVSRNTRLQAPLQLQPLQKTVRGYGRDLAVPLIIVLDAAGRQTFNIQCPANGNAAAVGTTPHNFNPRIEGYRHLDILKMVVFYNQTFDIQAQDDLPDRINKFRRFLAEY